MTHALLHCRRVPDLASLEDSSLKLGRQCSYRQALVAEAPELAAAEWSAPYFTGQSGWGCAVVDDGMAGLAGGMRGDADSA